MTESSSHAQLYNNISPVLFTTLDKLVRCRDDFQKLRIANGNRIAQNFRAKIGVKPGQSIDDRIVELENNINKNPDKEDKDTQRILNMILKEYQKIQKDKTEYIISNNITNLQDNTVQKILNSRNGIITNTSELVMIDAYQQALLAEKDIDKNISKYIKNFDIYNKYLANVAGCGPILSAIIITRINIYKAKYVSSLWAYFGVSVVHEHDDEGNIIRSRGVGRFKEHLIDREYIDKNGQKNTRKSIRYNPYLKTKALGVLAKSLIMHNDYYKKVNENYIVRLSNMKQHKDKSKLHLKRMGKRYVIKIFLKHLYEAWRPMVGLPCHRPYEEAKLGHRPHGSPSHT